MAKYEWDKDLIASFMLNPTVGLEFDEAFAFLETKKDLLDTKLGLRRVLNRNFCFMADNPYLYEIFNKLITPNTIFFGVKNKSKKVSIDHALDLTNAFYSSLDSEVYNAFQAHFNNRFTHLMAVPTSRTLSKSAYSGHCYTSETAKDCLIDFLASKNYEMISILVHEYAHAIAFTLRNYILQSAESDIFGEIESLFIELLANDWFIKNTGFKDEAANETKKIYNEIIGCAQSYLETCDVCSMISDMSKNNQKINMGTIIAESKNQFVNMPAYYLKKLLKSPIEYNIPYGYSGLIAIELYQIYIQNPQEAFDLYKRIICMQTKDAMETQISLEQMGIIAGKHFEDYARSLKR